MSGRSGAASVLVAMTVVVVVVASARPEGFGGTDVVLILAAMGFCVVGAVVIARTDASRIGWILSLVGLSLMGSGIAATVADPTPLALTIGSAFWLLAFAGIGLLMTLFPSGTAPGRRWRWLGPTGAAVTVLAVVQSLLAEELCLVSGDSGCVTWVTNPIGIPGIPDPEFSAPLTVNLLFGFLVVAAASMVVRFRRSTGVERLQLKWVALAVVGFAIFILASFLVETAGLRIPDLVGTIGIGLVMLGLPASVGVALTRYRLYEIDRIITRTVAYTLVAGVVAAVYAVPVVVLPGLVDGSGDLVVAGSTLAAAAAFTPVRRRVQKAVDRRFDRSRYDTAREVSALADRLRSGATITDISTEVNRLVTHTIRPDTTSLWIRERP